MKAPQAVRELANALAELPSIGPRQAMRLAFYLVHVGENTTHHLANVLLDFKKIKTCANCFFIHDGQGTLCEICSSTNRNQSVIIVLEKETDLLSFENTGKYSGRYFIIGAIPKTGILEESQKLRLQSLKAQIQKNLGGQAEEIILGFSPTNTGEFNASLIIKELTPFAKRISRLGRGLPTGGEIEFADDETLGSALAGRY